MKKNFNSNTENSDQWYTPRDITDSLGKFDLDPCTSEKCKLPIIASTNYTVLGLHRAWKGRVWCNPPYGNDTFDWIKKLADHGNGIALIFARTETKGFHAQIWERADAIFFFKGRLRFFRKDGTRGGSGNAPSCLVAYGRNNVIELKRSILKGKFILLSTYMTV
ncbi:hypothetical protein LCGC14_1833080 [marine sediment metagenome]|uniref:Adenine methyltransferase n=1 Tax=marine sediment metagenome TaxID=412755 RepID=A0A0F9IUZ9_9ZZZZ